MPKWPWVSRKKYERDLEFYRGSRKMWMDTALELSDVAIKQSIELSQLKQPRDKQGRFVRKG